MKISKAIIPLAGYGTRRLPITKSIEKCMLPLLNRPTIDYVVQDVLRAGITDIYFVISDGASQLRSYYERNVQLEEYLLANGKADKIASITPPEQVRFHYIEQDQQDSRYGTSLPVWLARDYVADEEQFLVIMGDQCLYRADGGSEAADLIDAVQTAGVRAGMLGVPVPWEHVDRYGVIEKDESGHFVQIVEKPALGNAPSNLNNASFYLFDQELLEHVRISMQTPREGEYYITDPINEYVASGGALYVRESTGAYLDCGTVDGWVEANTYLLHNS